MPVWFSALLSFFAAAPAYAHPTIDEAVEAYRDADFDRALTLLVLAEGADHLERDDIESLLLWRALVQYARGDETEWRADLERLARLDPEYALGPDLPPRFRGAFEEIRARGDRPLSLEVTVRPTPGGLEAQVRVSGDPGGLVRGVVLAGRIPAQEWLRTTAPRLVVDVENATALDYYAELYGAGGAVLLSAGTPTAPLRWTRIEPRATVAAPRADDDTGSVWPWFVGVGATLLLAGGVVAAVLLATAAPDTQFGPPSPR